MLKHSQLVWVGILGILLPAGALAQQPFRWHPTLESAKREAAQTGRLVLIHFWADWCYACKKMERDVFTRPEVAAAVHANYAPVKVNADFFPGLGKQYGVTTLPADVIITPAGQLVEKLHGVPTAAQYVARLNQVLVDARQRSPAVYAQASSGQPPTMVARGAPPPQAPRPGGGPS